MSQIKIATVVNQCPYCKAAIGVDESQKVCQRCLARHHVGCWEEHGHCAVYGCAHPGWLEPANDSAISTTKPRTVQPHEVARSQTPADASPPFRRADMLMFLLLLAIIVWLGTLLAGIGEV